MRTLKIIVSALIEARQKQAKMMLKYRYLTIE
jgi:hypothetical protein